MKLISYIHNSTYSCGILTEHGIIDILSHPFNTLNLTSILDIIQKSPESIAILKTIKQNQTPLIHISDVQLMSPIIYPGKLLALACNYPQHLAEHAKSADQTDNPRHTTTPWPFLMPRTSIAAPDTVIAWPGYSKQLDHEIELVIVIGKKCKDISSDTAKEYIFGYTIANDISARSVTYKRDRVNRPRDEFYDWLAGKWADGFLPMGPCVVTADEIDDPQNLNLELKINGQTRQNSNTSQMIYNIYEITAFLSHIMTLEPGDIICTGTPHGVGQATGKFLQPGDIIECAIEKIGTLTNTVGQPPEIFYEPLKIGKF